MLKSRNGNGPDVVYILHPSGYISCDDGAVFGNLRLGLAHRLDCVDEQVSIFSSQLNLKCLDVYPVKSFARSCTYFRAVGVSQIIS